MKLDIATPVRYPDGEQVGSIHKVVFDPETAAVREIVVETPELLGRLVLVPVDRLRDDPGGVLTLDSTRDEVSQMPEYVMDRFISPPEGWTLPPDFAVGDALLPVTINYPVVPMAEESNTGEGMVEWSQGTEVVCSDGSFGSVDQVLIDESGTMTGVVIRSDADETVRWLVPLDLIASADSQILELRCTLAELATQAQPYNDHDTEMETDSLVPGE